MNIESDQATAVTFSEETVYLRLRDGRVIGAPLAWYPWLKHASEAERAEVELYEMSVYFPLLDDGLDVEEMLKGEPPSVKQVSSSAVVE